MTAPLPANEATRLAALRDYHILDSANERMYDNIIELVASICRVPMATISLVDSSRQWFKARVGINESETPRDVAFCAHTILDAGPMIVSDARHDSRFAQNALVTGSPHIRFYAGFPLTSPEGLNLGALCAIDQRPRKLNTSQRQAMHILARQVMALLELRRVSARLAESLENVKTLHALLPICAWCKRIRDDEGYWKQIESYLTSHAGTQFTHGICADCMEKLLKPPRQAPPQPEVPNSQ